MRSTQQIKIGLIGYDPSWQLLLDQIGVSWSTIDDMATLARHSLIIVNKPVEKNDRHLLNYYLKSGGSLLYTVHEKHKVASCAKSKKYLTSLPPQIRAEYSFYDVFDIGSSVYLFENESIVQVQSVEQGIQSCLGIDVSTLVNTFSTTRKNFYSHTGVFPHERVSHVSKNALRKFIFTHIEFLHHRRNLPFVHKWFYPKKNRSIFTFRIDSDKGNKDQIEEIYQLSAKHRIPTSWFLDVKSHEQWLDYFGKFESQEIGVHCYDHTIHKNEVRNRENFEKALHLLKEKDLTIHGMSVPTGAWSNNIGTIVQDLQFKYSSEFAYDYDNIPSFPYLDRGFSSAVQLPVHPVCIGTLLREGYRSGDMVKYFKDIVDRKILLKEPICLYHHPTHRCNEVFDEVFQYINAQNILCLSYNEYAEWWKRRDHFEFAGDYDGVKLKANVSHPHDTWIRISMPNGSETIVPPADEILLDAIQFEKKQDTFQIPNDIMRTRSFSMKHLFQNALDWWIKTTE
ncbi:MAG: hypothetical protein HYV29_02985 [Ignavibacteriales bacterium]|nr:hypothetical protein [Ignavibacteriales bacterium]